MIEAVMFWNEPNNKSHWAFEIDPDWRTFAEMTKLAAHAVARKTGRYCACSAASHPSTRGL